MYVFTIDTIFSFAEHRTRTPLASSEYSKLSSKKKTNRFSFAQRFFFSVFFLLAFLFSFHSRETFTILRTTIQYSNTKLLCFSFFLSPSLSYVRTLCLIPICYRCSKSCTCSDNIGITM